jgi:hypothetical protein
VRDWMEEHLPPWLLGVIDWPWYRLFGRCSVCGRRIVLHTPWALYVCERTPLPIELAEQGLERLAQDAMLADLPGTDWQLEPVVPVSHAKPA